MHEIFYERSGEGLLGYLGCDFAHANDALMFKLAWG
jgi:hypothetical protein